MAERPRGRPRLALLLAAAGALSPGAAAPAPAQGPGSAGAELLQMPAGARATALGGAYTAVSGDPDAVFYNPASVAWLRQAAGLGYQAYVQDVTLGSFSGALRAGPVGLGGGLLFLDAGTVEEIVPDPAFGGERGRGTGERAGATEAAARVAAARTLAGGRAAAGVALGIVTSDLAGVTRDAVFVDAGAQLRVGGRLSLGGSVRNMGTALGGDEARGDAPLPAQARLGAAYHHPLGGTYGARGFADVVWGITEESAGLALGAEAGLLPADGGISAVLRLGAAFGEGEGHLGRLRFGGGISLGPLGLDYAVQVFEYLGTIHRVGIRWAR